VLGIGACAINWPLGLGNLFRGLFDRRDSTVHLFERTARGAYRAPERVTGLEDDFVKQHIDEHALAQSIEEIDMLEGAGHAFDRTLIDKGQLTPVFFGSASNNFGVQLLLDAFLELAPPPSPRLAGENLIDPTDDTFSAFVFKIQANMDPRHRDRIYFIRIVSGTFKRDMNVHNPRSGKSVRLANSQRLFAQDRHTVDEAYAGDVVGVVGNYDLRIGDTLSEKPGIVFDETPRFIPECFASLHNDSPAHYKRFREGLEQLLQEGVIQQYAQPQNMQRIPLLGAVGPLQFEVVQARLKSEYNAEARIEPAPYQHVRWIKHKTGADWHYEDVNLPSGTTLANDEQDRPVLLLEDEWAERFFSNRNPDFEILQEAPAD
jgi:peptide chain release factor 3